MKMTVDELLAIYDVNLPVFREMWAEAEENERYLRADHYTPRERADIEAQDREAYSVGLTSSKINQVLAEQKRNRTEWNLVALTDPADEVKAMVGNYQYRDLEHRCEIPDLESDIFQSGVGVKYGVAEIYVDRNGLPAVRKVHYKDFIWDSNATNYTKNDALFQAKIRRAYRFQVAEEYGKSKANKQTARYHERFGKSALVHYCNESDTEDLDLLSIFTHYQKVVRPYHVVVFNDWRGFAKRGVIEEEFEKEKDAKAFLKSLKIPYLLQGLPLGEHGITKTDKVKLDKYEFTIDEILSYEKTDMEEFSFSVYSAYHHEGKIWCLADVLKSVQIFIDRYLMQIDFALGTDIKDAYEIVVTNLAEGWNFEDALHALNEGGKIPVAIPGTIQAIQGKGASPQWLQMMETMVSFLEDLAGGRSFQGLRESSRESGIAIMAKQEQGRQIANLFLDNLSRWKRDLGRKLLYYLKRYDKKERLVKIMGDSLSPRLIEILAQQGLYVPSKVDNGGFMRINSKFAHLADAEVELKVSENRLSESHREKTLNELTVLGQQNPLMYQVPEFITLLLENSNIEWDKRERLVQGYTQVLEQQAQAAQEERGQKIEDAKTRRLSAITNATNQKEKNDVEKQKAKSQGSNKA